jgi:hypothetical protein
MSYNNHFKIRLSKAGYPNIRLRKFDMRRTLMPLLILSLYAGDAGRGGAVNTGTSVNGRLLAQTAITLQMNAITEPSK